MTAVEAKELDYSEAGFDYEPFTSDNIKKRVEALIEKNPEGVTHTASGQVTRRPQDEDDGATIYEGRKFFTDRHDVRVNGILVATSLKLTPAGPVNPEEVIPTDIYTLYGEVAGRQTVLQATVLKEGSTKKTAIDYWVREDRKIRSYNGKIFLDLAIRKNVARAFGLPKPKAKN